MTTSPTPFLMACNGCTHVGHLSFRSLQHRADTQFLGGGMPITTNRTYWPIGGGAVAFQPGWFQGHATAFLYINLGIGTTPENYSLVMQPVWEISGPTNGPYPGSSVCMPQVPMPANLTVNEGDNATIQVVENAKHGAALFSVR